MSENKSERFKKTRLFFKAFNWFLKILFMPMYSLLVFMKDEYIRRECNSKLPLGQVQSICEIRKKNIITAIALTVIQSVLFILLCFGSLVYEDYYGLYDGVVEFFETFQHEIFTEIFSSILFNIFCITSLIANIQYYFIYKFPKSRYQKFFKALKDNGIEQKEGMKPFWYYPRKMALLDLVGRTGEDLVKNNPALWNQAAFEPTQDVKKLPDSNQFIITTAVKKKSNSTLLYDRYEEWTALQQDTMKNYNWLMGEYVNRNEYLWKDAFEDFSLAFIGMSGSGKTEAMKMWLMSFLCKHPDTHLVICDLKMTGDWDVFAPTTETGKIIKTVEETLLAISYFDDLLSSRTEYMAKHSYKNIRTLSEAENIVVPPVLLIIDEFPQMSGPLKWDMQSRRDATPANTLFKLYTKGRSFGLWVILGSQFGGGDAIPSEINKNCKVHVMLRTGSEGESMQWINSPKAFYLGKNGLLLEDGSEDKQIGYAYVDNEVNFVRFWYCDDYLIIHEFKKYGVKTINGMAHFSARKMGLPMKLREKLKLVKGDKKKLNRFDLKMIEDNERAVKFFEESYKVLEANPHQNLTKIKKPIGMLWKDGETVEEYFKRTREIRSKLNSGEVIDVETKTFKEQSPVKTTTESKKNDNDEFEKLFDDIFKKKEEKAYNKDAALKKEKTKDESDFDSLFNEIFSSGNGTASEKVEHDKTNSKKVLTSTKEENDDSDKGTGKKNKKSQLNFDDALKDIDLIISKKIDKINSKSKDKK